MSAETNENPIQMSTVDVDVKPKENVRNFYKTCDSDNKTGESSSVSTSSLHTSEVQPRGHCGSQDFSSSTTDTEFFLDTDTNCILSITNTISPDLIERKTEEIKTVTVSYPSSTIGYYSNFRKTDQVIAAETTVTITELNKANDHENTIDLFKQACVESDNKITTAATINKTNDLHYQEAKYSPDQPSSGNDIEFISNALLIKNADPMTIDKSKISRNQINEMQDEIHIEDFTKNSLLGNCNQSLLSAFNLSEINSATGNIINNSQKQDTEDLNGIITKEKYTAEPLEKPCTIGNNNLDMDKLATTKQQNEDINMDTDIRIVEQPKLDNDRNLMSTETLYCSTGFIDHSYLVCSNNRDFTTSSISLNDHNEAVTHNLISKSPFSRSAENISLTDHCAEKFKNLNFSNKDLNREKILNEFANQKTKVAATQKLPPDVIKTTMESLQNHDSKYARIPKELLHQDLGSLVKNVHGIFSSVSGTLKNAYNQTQKAPRTPLKNISLPLPNGKLMVEIFEDSEKTAGVQNLENLEKSSTKSSMQYSILKKESNDSVGKSIEDDCKNNIYKLQIESMEKALADVKKENTLLRERVKEQVDELHSRDTSFKEMEVKIEMMSKRLEQADREKNAAVMRYASVECTAIEAKRQSEKAAMAEKAAVTEMELMGTKLKSAAQEKQRICQLYDDKCHELANSERELAKIRDDMKELEGRLKWTQSKLRMEMDAYKETAERAERLSQQVSDLGAAKEIAATNATESARAKQLEQELKEIQAALILCRHERDDLESRLTNTTQLLDTCRKERDAATTSLAEASSEVERLRESNLRLEEEAAELAALRAQAALADTLSAQLQRESERASLAEEALWGERARAETCARREAAALQHAATLTAQHVQQRASATDTLHKAQALEVENESLRERVSSSEQEAARLRQALSEETDKRSRETRALARKVAELTEEAAEANKKLEWEKGENEVLKKKHANAIKELNRELTRALKRCEQLEAKLPSPEPDSNRIGSVSSLSSSESAQMDENNPRTQNGHADALPDIQVREPDRQALIERIVSLQRAAARRAERCEFLEEHAKQLTKELRGKSRLLRHLLCSIPAGAVADSHSDAHKKEIARLGGGAMAAVWGGDATGMTLELSLEMNNKLQAVLEDALLKNITLKENMDTLGEEIARLKGQMNANDKKA